MLAHLLFIFCLEWVLIIKVHVLMSVSYLFFLQASNIEKECKYGQQNLTSENNENSSVSSLINRFEQINNIPIKPTDDHAIVDDVDVKQLKVILGHEPENKDIADIQDNKTDDDQPDLETDDSSGGKNKMKHDPSMDVLTERTDITTPVEMGQESGISRRDDFDTSYQISDLPNEYSKHDKQATSPATLHKETLFEITDLEDLTDIEENKDDIPDIQMSSRSDHTLVADSPDNLDVKIRKREKNIDKKFERISLDLSDSEMNVEKEMFMNVSQISKEEEEEAAQSFDKIIFENFAEDKSEDWLTHGSEVTPDKDVEQDIFGAPDDAPAAKGLSLGY